MAPILPDDGGVHHPLSALLVFGGGRLSTSSPAPRLTLLSLTDSFSEAWAPLARECGLTLEPVNDAESMATMASGGAVWLVCGAGAEERLEGLLRGICKEGVEVVAVGALPDHRIAATAVLAGAAEYFALPLDYQLLRSWLLERAERLRQRSSGSVFGALEEAKYRFEGILGSSLTLRQSLERAARVIPHAGVTVLITGETGTGKELLARAIHYNGPRRDAPFVDINCAAIPEQLLESELFGHERGSFTGATSSKPGLFEVAQGGTIFLDEIAQLPFSLQGKLLRVLEQRTIRRIGGTRTIEVDVRVLTATHVDLTAAAARGEFREDLLHRLNVIPISLPPLRARSEDVVILARSFLSRFARDYHLPEPDLTPQAERALRMHPWPGNVRELRNVMERTLIMATRNPLDAGDLQLKSETAPQGGGAIPFPATLSVINHAAVESMIRLCDGNKSESARRLAISRTRLQRLLVSTIDDNDDPESGREDA